MRALPSRGVGDDDEVFIDVQQVARLLPSLATDLHRTMRMERNESDAGRDRYRDNDDVRQPLEGDQKTGGSADTKSEARGNARENVGNTSRETDADVRGADENDNTRQRPHRDRYDDDLERKGS